MEHEDGTNKDALEFCFTSANFEVDPENRIQKKWTVPIETEISQMILNLEPADVKRFIACQDKFGLQWMNVIPCINIRLKLSDQQLRIAIGLRLGSKTCKNLRCF